MRKRRQNLITETRRDEHVPRPADIGGLAFEHDWSVLLEQLARAQEIAARQFGNGLDVTLVPAVTAAGVHLVIRLIESNGGNVGGDQKPAALLAKQSLHTALALELRRQPTFFARFARHDPASSALARCKGIGIKSPRFILGDHIGIPFVLFPECAAGIAAVQPRM
jgi:hypothetical protein